MTKIGYSIPAIVREIAMDHLGTDVCPHPLAQRLADAVNDHLCGADWLELRNGLTFERAFDPSLPGRKCPTPPVTAWPSCMAGTTKMRS